MSYPPTVEEVQAMRDRERRWAALLADKRMRDDVWLAKMTTQPKGLRWPLLDDPDRP